jgi:hypothetical protein
MFYVEATVGEAKDLLDPDRESGLWEAAEDLDAFIFVAYGEFRWRDFLDGTRGPTYETLWVVVPLHEEGMHSGTSNEEYDLEQFGDVHEVPLPLPEFPTPVNLETAD